jgi:hypothetical protein
MAVWYNFVLNWVSEHTRRRYPTLADFFTYQWLLGCGMGNLCPFWLSRLPVLQAQTACL